MKNDISLWWPLLSQFSGSNKNSTQNVPVKSDAGREECEQVPWNGPQSGWLQWGCLPSLRLLCQEGWRHRYVDQLEGNSHEGTSWARTGTFFRNLHLNFEIQQKNMLKIFFKIQFCVCCLDDNERMKFSKLFLHFQLSQVEISWDDVIHYRTINEGTVFVFEYRRAEKKSKIIQLFSNYVSFSLHVRDYLQDMNNSLKFDVDISIL